MPLLRKRKKEAPQASTTPQATPPQPSSNPSASSSTASPSTSFTPARADTPLQPPPRSFAELEDLVQEVVSGSWDPSISIQSWRRALSQLAQEAKVYYNEGNIDVRLFLERHWTYQLIPRVNFSWHSLGRLLCSS
jgi:hypothetical protein